MALFQRCLRRSAKHHGAAGGEGGGGVPNLGFRA